MAKRFNTVRKSLGKFVTDRVSRFTHLVESLVPPSHNKYNLGETSLFDSDEECQSTYTKFSQIDNQVKTDETEDRFQDILVTDPGLSNFETEYADRTQLIPDTPPQNVHKQRKTHKKQRVDDSEEDTDDTDSDDDKDDENCGTTLKDTSDYFSNEGIKPPDDKEETLLRTKSEPDICKKKFTTVNIGVVKDSIIGTGTVIKDSNKYGWGNHDADTLMLKRVKEKTQHILKSQKLPGVETEPYMAIKVKTQHAPKFAVIKGKGGKFLAYKYLKDNHSVNTQNEPHTDVFVVDSPQELEALEKTQSSIIMIRNVAGDIWKNIIKNELFPILQENESITVIATLEESHTLSGFEQDGKLQDYVIDIPTYSLGLKTRQAIIFHEMDRYGVSVCGKGESNTSKKRRLAEHTIDFIARNTSNLFYIQRVSAFFARYEDANVDILSMPYPAHIEYMKRLSAKESLALLALIAFKGSLSEKSIEVFRAAAFTSGKDFRRSSSHIAQQEISVNPKALTMLFQLAKDFCRVVDMWDTIENGLRRLSGTIVQEYDGTYCFDGVSMQYAFLLSGCIPLDAVIMFCDRWFLYNQIVQEALSRDDMIFAYLKQSDTKAKRALFERLYEDIEDREVCMVWGHRLMAERWFVAEFLAYLKQNTGKLSKCLLKTDRREPYNVLYFGLEKQFRIADTPANITELILTTTKYLTWRKRRDYNSLKGEQENAFFAHAIELERESTVKIALKLLGVVLRDEYLLLATETRNFSLIQIILRAEKMACNYISYKTKCEALKRSLELYAENSTNAGNEKRVFKLLSCYASINYKRDDVESLIIMATKTCNLTMLNLLMNCHIPDDDVADIMVDEDAKREDEQKNAKIPEKREKLDLDLTTTKGKTALGLAVENGSHDVLKLLLKKGADQRKLTRRNMELPVMIAVQKDDWQSLKLLMENDQTIINEGNRKGQTLLQAAVIGERLKCLDLLLSSANLQINAFDGQNETALHKAVACGQVGSVRLLLENGADISLTDINKNTPLHVAIIHKEVDCIQAILKAAQSQNLILFNKVLFDAIKRNDQGLLQIMFDCGYDINYQHESFGTPLILAIEMRNYELMKFLMERGADPGLKRKGIPTIHTVHNRKDCEILRLLLQYGASITAVNDYTGNTILHVAVLSNSHELATDIINLDTKCDLVDMANFKGDRPLHIACRHANEKCVQILMQNGATRGVVNNDRMTPEMLAEKGLKMERFRKYTEHEAAFARVLKALTSTSAY